MYYTSPLYRYSSDTWYLPLCVAFVLHVISFILDFELPFFLLSCLLQYDNLVFMLLMYLVHKYGHKLFYCCLKLTMKSSSWQPLSSLLVIISA